MKNQLELAWLAGLIDGEGNLGIYGRQVIIRVSLHEKDKFVLEKVQKIAGGHLYYNSRPHSRNPNWSGQWLWVVTKQKDVYELCQILLPYLVLKKTACKKVMAEIERKAHLRYGI